MARGQGQADDDETLRESGRVRAAWTAHRVSRPWTRKQILYTHDLLGTGRMASSDPRRSLCASSSPTACQASPALSDLPCPRGLTRWTHGLSSLVLVAFDRLGPWEAWAEERGPSRCGGGLGPQTRLLWGPSTQPALTSSSDPAGPGR